MREQLLAFNTVASSEDQCLVFFLNSAGYEADSPNNLPNSSTPSQADVPLKSLPLTFNQVSVNFASLTNPISFRPQFDRSNLCKLVKLMREGGARRIWLERLR